VPFFWIFEDVGVAVAQSSHSMCFWWGNSARVLIIFHWVEAQDPFKGDGDEVRLMRLFFGAMNPCFSAFTQLTSSRTLPGIFAELGETAIGGSMLPA